MNNDEFLTTRFNKLVNSTVAELENVKLQFGIAIKRARLAEEREAEFREMETSATKRAQAETMELRTKLKYLEQK